MWTSIIACFRLAMYQLQQKNNVGYVIKQKKSSRWFNVNLEYKKKMSAYKDDCLIRFKDVVESISNSKTKPTKQQLAN